MKNFTDRWVSLREEAGGGDGGGAGAGAGGGADAAALAAELATLKTANAAQAKELDAAKTSIAEKDTAVQYWHSKATAKPAAAAAEPEPDVDLLDVIGNKGAKGLDEVLKTRGFVRQADVESLIAGTVDRVTREGKAVERFPELKDPSSDFFKAYKQNLGALAKDGIKGVAATELAAERTYLQFVDEGKMDTAAQRKAKADKAEGDDETEAERIARANAAGGATGRRASGKEARPTETAEDKAQIARICQGMGITVEQWKARAEKGVQFGN
jgi:hypothetical protein